MRVVIKGRKTAIIGAGNYYPVQYLPVELLYRGLTTMESIKMSFLFSLDAFLFHALQPNVQPSTSTLNNFDHFRDRKWVKTGGEVLINPVLKNTVEIYGR